MAEEKKSFLQRFYEAKNEIAEKELSKNKAGGMGFKYLPLNELLGSIQPVMKKQKLILSFDITTNGTDDYMTAIIFDSLSDNKHFARCKMVPSSTQRDPAQANGSGITYSRRYALEMLFGLVGDIKLDPDESTPVKEEPKKEKKEAKSVSVDLDLDLDFEDTKLEIEDTKMTDEEKENSIKEQKRVEARKNKEAREASHKAHLNREGNTVIEQEVQDNNIAEYKEQQQGSFEKLTDDSDPLLDLDI